MRAVFDTGHRLDLDHYFDLGGENGLRGYPLRYQQGTRRTIAKIEERIYTEWSLWRLFDIGGAAFFDTGRTAGANPIGAPQLGWLKDAGVGLRLGNSRSSLGNVIHIDLATPIGGRYRHQRTAAAGAEPKRRSRPRRTCSTDRCRRPRSRSREGMKSPVIIAS